MLRSGLLVLGMCGLLALPEAHARRGEWSGALPTYSIEVSGPLDPIPSNLSMAGRAGIQLIANRILSGGLTPEERYAVLGDAGFKLFDDIRDSQGAFHWYHVRIHPTSAEQIYDGMLGQLRFVLIDGTRVAPLEIVTTPVTQERAMNRQGASAPVIQLYPEGEDRGQITFAQFRSEGGGRSPKWIAFIRVPRSLDPSAVLDITFEEEALTNLPGSSAGSTSASIGK